MLALFIFVWFGTGFIAGCMYYHHFQTEYPLIAEDSRDNDSIMAVVLMAFGPMGLIAGILTLIPYGLALPFTDPLSD